MDLTLATYPIPQYRKFEQSQSERATQMAGQTTLTATGNPLAGVSLEGARCIDFDDHDVIKHQNMRLLAVKSKTGSFLAPRMFVPCLEGLEHPGCLISPNLPA